MSSMAALSSGESAIELRILPRQLQRRLPDSGQFVSEPGHHWFRLLERHIALAIDLNVGTILRHLKIMPASIGSTTR
jgi:hypothetical protein